MSTKTVMGLDERALLVKLSISAWSARKTDKEISREITESKNARSDRGTFSKILISREALKKIQKVESAARDSHRTLTLPWNDDGSRIITTEGYQHYSKVMRDYRTTMQEAVDDFLNGYDELVQKAKSDLGSMFNADDYPSIGEIRAKFNFQVEPTQIPMSRDFRAKVTNAEAKAIAKDIEARTNSRIDTAIKDIWQRIADVTEKMFTRLEEFKPREGLHRAESTFKDTLVENIRSLTEIMPSLNINSDPEITRIHKEMVEHLCHYDAEDLRDDVGARKRTAKSAKKIYDKVSKYLA